MDPKLLALGLTLLLAGTIDASPVGQCLGINTVTRDDQTCDIYWVCTVRGWVEHACQQNEAFDPNMRRCRDSNSYDCPYSSRPNPHTRGCSSTSCHHGGVCMPSINGPPTCHCTAGWTGHTCQVRTSTSGGGGSSQDEGVIVSDGGVVVSDDECYPNCENDGRCLRHEDEYVCFCPGGFGGDQCQIELDPCDTLTCENGGTCVENNGVGTCSCPAGFAGATCQTEITAECEALQCQNNALCAVVGRSTVCDCLEGFAGDRCQYADHCRNVTCLNEGTCEVGDQGQAECTCAVGYTGNFCEIALDCAGYTCQNEGQCIIANNSRRCECAERTQGEFCERRQQCAGDGVAPCKNGGMCHNSQDGFVCACPIGRKGPTCQDFRACSENVVCDNGGTCVDTPDDGAQCTCPTGFQGPRCDVPEDDCGGCQNGGVCEIPIAMPANTPASDMLCACPANFTGDHCETETNNTIPCSERAGISGERYHFYVFPDLVQRDYVYLCHLGRLTHLRYCEQGLWYDPFAQRCHTDASFAAARQTAGQALFPLNIP